MYLKRLDMVAAVSLSLTAVTQSIMAETKEKLQGASVKRGSSNAGHIRISIVMLFAVGVLAPVLMMAAIGVLPVPFSERTAEAALIPSLPTSNFGGRIIGYAPMIPNPLSPATPLCPAHMIIINYVPAGPRVLGLYVVPTAAFRYLYSYVFNGASLYYFPPALPIGTATLGKDLPVPWATCTLAYPVVHLLALTGVYYIGTALHP